MTNFGCVMKFSIKMEDWGTYLSCVFLMKVSIASTFVLFISQKFMGKSGLRDNQVQFICTTWYHDSIQIALIFTDLKFHAISWDFPSIIYLSFRTNWGGVLSDWHLHVKERYPSCHMNDETRAQPQTYLFDIFEAISLRRKTYPTCQWWCCYRLIFGSLLIN